MKKVIVFDLNETLTNLAPLHDVFATKLGDGVLVKDWFNLMLHSSMVVTATNNYHGFGALADAALDVVAGRVGVPLNAETKAEILTNVRHLPPHEDVIRNLARLKTAGHHLAVLTNSSQAMLTAQTTNAGIADYFDALISVETIGAFKPSAAVYQMAADTLNIPVGEMWMVAAHDWDIAGALHAGCRGVYVDRGAGYHPLYARPEIIAVGMDAAVDRLL